HLEGKEFLTGLGIPHFEFGSILRRAICQGATGNPMSAAAAGQALAVGAKGQAPDRGRVPLEGEDRLPGPRIPDLHGVVRSGAGQTPEVRTKGEGIPVQAESEGLRVSLRIPDLDALVTRAAGQALAVRAEGHASDFAGVPVEDPDYLAR